MPWPRGHAAGLILILAWKMPEAGDWELAVNRGRKPLCDATFSCRWLFLLAYGYVYTVETAIKPSLMNLNIEINVG